MTFRPPGVFLTQANLFGDPPDLSTPEGVQEVLDQKVADLKSRWELQIIGPHTVPAIKAEVADILAWANEVLPSVLPSNQQYLVRVTQTVARRGMNLNIRVIDAKTCDRCKGEGSLSVKEDDWCDDVHLGTFTTHRTCPSCGGEGKVPA